MSSATRVFVYEYLTGGGADAPLADVPHDLIAAGRSMRDALVGDFARLVDVEVTRGTRGREPAVGCVRDASPRAGESAAGFVARAAREHDVVLVVAPETGGILATLRAAVDDRKWLGCAPEAIALAASKTATREHLAARGVATPASGSLDAHDARDDSDWVVKPDDGAGCLDTRRFARFDEACGEAMRRRARGESVTLERWVNGPALSLSLLCRRGGSAEVISVNRQDIAIDSNGIVRYEGVRIAVRDPHDAAGRACADLARHVATAIPGLRGFVGIDVVEHPQRGPVVIEVNPRITCAYVGLSARLGRNLAHEMLERVRHVDDVVA